MQAQDNQWTVRDVITTVLFTLLLIAIQFAINMLGRISNFISMVFSVGISMLVCAPVYFLMIRRVAKRFVSLVYMTIIGCVFLLMGNWFLLPWFVLNGIICEIILWKKDAASDPKRIAASWTISSFLYNGVNILPIYYYWDTFSRFAKESKMEQIYVDDYLKYYSSPGWLGFIVIFTTVCGFLGSILSIKMMRKHFEKSGIL